MKQTDKILRCGLVGFAVLLLAGSCSKNQIEIIYAPPQEGGSGGGGTTAASLVTFHASVESRNFTRALTPVKKNLRAQIYAYPGAAADASAVPAVQGAYQSPSVGLLQGVNGFRMYLPGGVYNFYGVSDNTQFSPPAFANGRSEPLINGIDYLWWAGLQQDVTSELAGIPVIFMHRATQIIFEVQAGAGITISQLVMVHLFPPVEGAQMNLTDGSIPAAAAYATKEIRTAVSGMLAQYTMLPVATAQPMKVYFDVLLQGENTPRTYEVDMPLPDGALKAGDSYRFLAVIDGNEVTFPQVSVRSWVDVDETGKPLYPSES